MQSFRQWFKIYLPNKSSIETTICKLLCSLTCTHIYTPGLQFFSYTMYSEINYIGRYFFQQFFILLFCSLMHNVPKKTKNVNISSLTSVIYKISFLEARKHILKSQQFIFKRITYLEIYIFIYGENIL